MKSLVIALCYDLLDILICWDFEGKYLVFTRIAYLFGCLFLGDLHKWFATTDSLWVQVNVLTHTTTVKIHSWQQNAIKALKSKHEAEDLCELYNERTHEKGKVRGTLLKKTHNILIKGADSSEYTKTVKFWK